MYKTNKTRPQASEINSMLERKYDEDYYSSYKLFFHLYKHHIICLRKDIYVLKIYICLRKILNIYFITEP